MPVVSNTFERTQQADGRFSYVLRLYDQDNSETTLVGFMEPSTDVAAFISEKTTQVNLQLAENEFKQIVGI